MLMMTCLSNGSSLLAYLFCILQLQGELGLLLCPGHSLKLCLEGLHVKKSSTLQGGLCLCPAFLFLCKTFLHPLQLFQWNQVSLQVQTRQAFVPTLVVPHNLGEMLYNNYDTGFAEIDPS